MRVGGRRELWQELVHARWLQLPSPKAAPPLPVQLLDTAVLGQASRGECRRAAHWALCPAPLLLPGCAPPPLRLTALVLAAHASTHDPHSIDMGTLSRLCGHSPHQTRELLDRLVTTRALMAWQHNQEADQVLWQAARYQVRAARLSVAGASPP